MDLFSLFGNNQNGNAGALGALLPLLLGGKSADLGVFARSFDGNNPLSALAPFLGKREEEVKPSYPPLFGQGESPMSVLSSVLNSSVLSGQTAKTDHKSNAEYPYPLQYNRPEPVIKK